MFPKNDNTRQGLDSSLFLSAGSHWLCTVTLRGFKDPSAQKSMRVVHYFLGTQVSPYHETMQGQQCNVDVEW